MSSTVAIRCTDHLGNKFSSQHEMCVFWGKSDSTYIARLKAGLTQQEALEGKVNREKITDHKGNEFDSFTLMSLLWKINPDTVHERLNRGWDLEKALTETVDTSHGTSSICRDHKGIVYNSISDMCTHYGIGRTLYTYRINNGWDLEKALTTPVR